MSREDKNFLKEFASFKIFVPVQKSQSVLDLFWSNKMYLLIVIIGASVGVLVTRGFLKKRKLVSMLKIVSSSNVIIFHNL
ncbi:MAG TPA: hypothetical protein VF220_09125 [Nitrososphaeraceae archaeon]